MLCAHSGCTDKDNLWQKPCVISQARASTPVPECLQAALAGPRHTACMVSARRAARMHGFHAHTGLYYCLADKVVRGTLAHEHARSMVADQLGHAARCRGPRCTITSLRLGLLPREELRVGARGHAAGAGLHLIRLLHVLLCDTERPLIRLHAGRASARPGRYAACKSQTALQPLTRSGRAWLAGRTRAQCHYQPCWALASAPRWPSAPASRVRGLPGCAYNRPQRALHGRPESERRSRHTQA